MKMARQLGSRRGRCEAITPPLRPALSGAGWVHFPLPGEQVTVPLADTQPSWQVSTSVGTAHTTQCLGEQRGRGPGSGWTRGDHSRSPRGQVPLSVVTAGEILAEEIT